MKFLGDGERAYSDLEVLHRNLELMNILQTVYVKFLTEESYDYIIIDNPSGISPESEIDKQEVNIYYTLFPDSLNLRVYVSTHPRNVLESTIRYMNTLENNFYVRGYPIAFVINMIPPVDEEMERARERLNMLLDKSSVVTGVLIPIHPDLIGYEGGITEMPRLEEMKELVEVIVQGKTRDKRVIELNPMDRVVKLVKERRSLLIVGSPSSGKVELVGSILRNMTIDGKIKVALALTNERILERIKEHEKLDLLIISILPRYVEDRFSAKNIGDVLKMAKRLSTDIISRIGDSRIFVLYRTNDVSPSSPCCDLQSQRSEYWNTMIKTLRYKSEMSQILVCDEISNQCDDIIPFVDYVVRTFEGGGFKIQETL
ncbi:hypothetical protein [Metallosphaera javensis (ex Sakai et al. 2022)]|uniref:hypothetical protein n=1 Tax=Metallosphaera javensis (ex Sakai et al. 2022) TaxID=2775498 RepID=UPI0025837706